ncbi:MAG: RHS repeat-associated core domain-containing protein, partial [Spirochaetota bacterium]
GNTRVASVVKHKDETQAATYYYASDHLGSSSVLTTQQGQYHERIEYLPYGETWVEDAANKDSYTTPYKFTGKEQDKETGLYYFGARYYDARMSRWISTDPALVEGKYFPKPNDYDTEHDFYWYRANINIKKIPGIGGVYNHTNLNLYTYGGNNPIRYIDPDGKLILLGCSGKNDRGNQFVKAMMNWASEQGIEFDDKSREELKRIGDDLNLISDAKKFLFIASIYAAALDALKPGADFKDKVIALSNMAGVTSEALPDEIATAFGGMDYEQLGTIAMGMNLIFLNAVENNSRIFAIEYSNEGNQELSKFWGKVAEIMGNIRLRTAETIVDSTNKKAR